MKDKSPQEKNKRVNLVWEYVRCNLCGNDNSKLLIIKNDCNLVRCKTCGLVYVNPQPCQSKLFKLYTFDQGYYVEAVRDAASRKDTLFDHSLLNKIEDIDCRYKKRGRILDVGCGTGLFLKAAKDYGWDVYGVEPSEDLGQFAREEFGLNIVSGVLHDANFPAQHFDVITLWDVLEHVRNPYATLFEVNRLLKRDGLLLISTPNIDGLEPR